MSFLSSFVKKSSALADETSSQPSSSLIDPMRTSKTKIKSVLTVERTEYEGVKLGGSDPEEPRRRDPDAIASQNPPSSEHLPIFPSTTEFPNIQEKTDVIPKNPPSIPAQDDRDTPSMICSVLATALSAAKMVLEILRHSSHNFPPLNLGVAAGICTLLKQFEQTASNKDDCRRLRLRIGTLIKSHSDDCNEMEKQRRTSESLTKELDAPFLALDSKSLRYFIVMFSATISVYTKKLDAIFIFQRGWGCNYRLSVACEKDVESGDVAWLDRLSHTKDASHLPGNRRRCIPWTELLQEIEAWIKNPEGLRVYWLGMAGTGKFAIAQSVAERT